MFSDIAQKAVETGQTVCICFGGQEFSGKVVRTSVVKFVREYYIEFQDGSRRWFTHQFLENQKN